MPSLLSGASLRAGSTTTFITLANAQPQLPATPSTTTGFTVVTRVVPPSELVTEYSSSLGNIEFNNGTLYGNTQDLNITVIGTGTGTVIIAGSVANTSTNTGVLVVRGGIGIADGLYAGKDIHVNGLTIGQGYSNNIGGVNNIVIAGNAQPQINSFPVGQQNINIGYNSLRGIETAYKVISIGRYAASTGTLLENTIAIGDSSLMKIGSTQTEFIGTVTAVISVNTMTLQVANHNLTTGTRIVVDGVLGMTELNGQYYYVNPITSSSIELYYDINLQNKVNGSSYNDYVSNGKISRTRLWNGNFAIGSNAGKNLIDGEQNFFLGLDPAQNFTTGSYNFFMGHSIAQNMRTGNANISIGGDNMVDGLDNQVNIGSVFYYNGSGALDLNADTTLGLGTQSISTDTGALIVDGGVGISGNLNIGGTLNIPDTTNATSTSTGALVVAGGVGVAGDMYVGGTLFASALYAAVSGTSSASEKIRAHETSGTNYYLAMTEATGGYTSIFSPLNITYDDFNKILDFNAVIGISTTTDSASTVTGALVVTGGVGIGGKLNVENGITTQNGDIGIGIQTNAGHEYFAIHVNKFTGALEFHPNRVTVTTSTTAVFVIDDDGGPTLSINPFKVTNASLSTSTTSGALQVTGGVGIQGSVYSNDGNPEEGNLLYTPRVTITNTGSPPVNPRVGDFWIDTTILAQLQYIKDGTSTFWIQTASL
jgi:hypothetical protein